MKENSLFLATGYECTLYSMFDVNANFMHQSLNMNVLMRI